MTVPESFRREVETLPVPLRTLLEEELAVGNEIVDISHGFPAAPCGACVSLARDITCAPGPDLHARSWPNWNRCRGFTDEKGHFVLIGPPEPEPPQLSMDEIRARMNGATVLSSTRPPAELPVKARTEAPLRVPSSVSHGMSAALRRFEESMKMDYDKWREGEGYDLAALREIPEGERGALESLLLRGGDGGVFDWRDIEALSVLDTPRARGVLLRALKEGSAAERAAVMRYAPGIFSEGERTASLVAALGTAVSYGGLTGTLAEVERWHPPEVIHALLHGLLQREGGVAVHYAAMLFYLHGKAESAFDWTHRPFFLQFNTEDPLERRAVFDELCTRLGIDSAHILFY